MEDLKVLELFSGIGGMHFALQGKFHCFIMNSSWVPISFILISKNFKFYYFSEFNARKD